MIIGYDMKRHFSKLLCVVTSVGALLLVSGCEHFGDERIREDLYTGSLYKFAHTDHPIQVGRGSLFMAIPIGINDKKLSREKRDELTSFLHYYRDQGTGRLQIKMPSNGRYQRASRHVLSDMQHELERMSINPESIRAQKYSASGAYPEIRLSFERYVATGPDCHGWNENLAQSENNKNAKSWGCATQRNLAAMVANPRDLKGPRGWAPRDARRRDAMWDKYIKGEEVSTKRGQDERVDASGIQR